MTNFLTRVAARSFAAESAIRPRVASLFEPASSEPASHEPVRDSETAVRGARAEESGTDASAEVEAASVVAPKTPDDAPVSVGAGQLTMDSLRRGIFARSDETRRQEDIAAAAKLRPRAEYATRSDPSSSARSDLHAAGSSGTSALHTTNGIAGMMERKSPWSRQAWSWRRTVRQNLSCLSRGMGIYLRSPLFRGRSWGTAFASAPHQQSLPAALNPLRETTGDLCLRPRSCAS